MLLAPFRQSVEGKGQVCFLRVSDRALVVGNLQERVYLTSAYSTKKAPLCLPQPSTAYKSPGMSGPVEPPLFFVIGNRQT